MTIFNSKHNRLHFPDICNNGKWSLFFIFVVAILSQGLLPLSLNAVATTTIKTSTKSKSNTMTNKSVSKDKFSPCPDFAYPKSVESIASKELPRALESRDYKAATLASLQIAASKMMIDRESIDSVLNQLNSISERLPAPYSAVLKLVEADLLSDYYNDISYDIRDRNLPSATDDIPVSLWDKKMFQSRILALCKQAWEMPEDVKEESLKNISFCLLTPKAADSAGMTIADFVALKADEYLSAFIVTSDDDSLIPFNKDESKAGVRSLGSEAGSFVSSILTQRVELLKHYEKPQIAYRLIKACLGRDYRGESSRKTLLRYIDEFKSSETELALMLLYSEMFDLESNVGLGDDVETDVVSKGFSLFDRCEELLKKYPSSIFSSALRSQLDRLTRQHLSVDVPGIISTGGTDVKVEMRNLNSAYLLIFSLPDSRENPDYSLANVLAKGHLVGTIPLTAQGKTPFVSNLNVTIPQLAPGYYAVVGARNPKLNSIVGEKKNKACCFRVSDLSVFGETCGKELSRVYAVSALNGSPLCGVSVDMYPSRGWNQKERNSYQLTTGSNGFAEIPDTLGYGTKAFDVFASKDNDKMNSKLNLYRNYPSSSRQIMGSLFTERRIVRPEDKVKFVSVLFKREGDSLKPAGEELLRVSLINASRAVVDTLNLITDASGRAQGCFDIPAEGMLGQWRISVAKVDNDKNGNSNYVYICDSPLRVEQYRNPTFRVVLNQPEMISSDSVLTLSGRVETYSGMPLQNASVKIEITTIPCYWRYMSVADGSYHTSINTGIDGTFKIDLSTEGLKNTPYENALFHVAAVVTSGGGETQSDEMNFSLDKSYHIQPDIPEVMKVEASELTLNVMVRDEVGNPCVKELTYSLQNRNSGDVVRVGSFLSPNLKLDVTDIPSGAYKLTLDFCNDSDKVIQAESIGNEDLTQNCEFLLWRESDSRPPIESLLWIPQTSLIANDNGCQIIMGSSFRNQSVMWVVSSKSGVVSREWMVVDNENKILPIAPPSDGEEIFVTFYASRNHKSEVKSVVVKPASTLIRPEINVQTFRENLTANSRETWRFKFEKDGKPMTDVSVVAVMTDAALNQLVPFSWTFNPDSYLSHFNPLDIMLPWWSSSWLNLYFNSYKSNYYYGINAPQWIYPMMGIHDYRKMAYCMSAMPERNSENLMMETADDIEGVLPESAMTVGVSPRYKGMNRADSQQAIETAADVDVRNVALRQSECPVAFFKPMLSAGSNGEVAIEFEVPDFNTTWAFQMLGYDSAMQSASIALKAISAKKVMVQASLPRFLRTGDVAQLRASLFNNTSEALKIGGVIEVKNPLNGSLIARKSFKPEVVAAAGTRLVSIEISIPNDIETLEVDCYAVSGGNSDGEQHFIPVLAASSPVVESVPFYLRPGQEEFELNIPRLGKESSVTLKYCDNPLWYVLTSLPPLVANPGVTATSLLRAYYGNAVGIGLLKDNPELADGLRKMTSLDSSMLTSNLEQNSSLKIVELNSTPWVNSAKSESLRMHSLSELLDAERATEVLDNLLTKIESLRCDDGGLAWIPGGNSSVWASGQTLLYFSMLSRFGYLPADNKTEKIICGIGAYCEKEYVKQWKLWKSQSIHNSKDETGYLAGLLLNYLYVKSGFAEATFSLPINKEFESLIPKALSGVEANWKDYSIYNKATAAILLNDNHKRDVANEILKSLGEFASVSEQNGMWFANLSSFGNSPWNKLITTCQVLEAFNDIDPAAQEVDLLRQWLLIQRQTEDWNVEPYGAELVQAILTSGSFGTGSPETLPQILINGKPALNPSDFESYGETVVDLSPTKISGGKLKVVRAGNSPAWGAIVSQSVEPLSSIKSFSIDGLSVEKEIYRLRDTPDGLQKASSLGTESDLMVGDQLRVMVTVCSDRDLEFVALTDERAASLEPIDQLSGYRYINGIPMYCEVRNAQTNFFIPYLPKGNYRLIYDCKVGACGVFAAGIATLQSQYAPEITAHSAGQILKIEEKQK